MADTPDTTFTNDELSFLEGYDPSRYPRPSVTVDVVLLTVRAGDVWVLVAQRAMHPARDRWALPGGFVGIEESLDEAAARVLRDKAGLTGVFTEQLFTFGAPDRDPRTRVISVAYFALVDPTTLERAVARFATDRLRVGRVGVPWSDEAGGAVTIIDERGAALPLAFDHDEIVGTAVKRIRGKLDYATIGFELLPPAFSLRELRLVHEAILGRPLNKDSFRRRVQDRGLVVATGERAGGVGHRPPELYAFARPSRSAASVDPVGSTFATPTEEGNA